MEASEVMALFVLGFFAVATLPIFLHFRGERRKRELDHIERMRAIEVGRSYPGETRYGLPAVPHWAAPHLIAVSIGAVVPLGVFACALLTSLIGGYQKDIWIAAGMVGLGGVISGTVLAYGAFKTTAAGAAAEDRSDTYINSKPLVDEDAYDVVSSRG
jgi:hypothetical protein